MKFPFYLSIQYKTHLTPEEVKKKIRDITVPVVDWNLEDIDMEEARKRKYKGYTMKNNRFIISLNEEEIKRMIIFIPKVKFLFKIKELYGTVAKGEIYDENYGSRIKIRIYLSIRTIMSILFFYAIIPSFFFFFKDLGLVTVIVPIILSILFPLSLIESYRHFKKDTEIYIEDLQEIFEAKAVEKL